MSNYIQEQSVRKTQKAVIEQTNAKIYEDAKPFCIWDRNGNNPYSIIQDKANAYNTNECPLCAENKPIETIK